MGESSTTMDPLAYEKHEELDLAMVDLAVEGFAEKLVAACRDTGVFRLVNHGVPDELSGRMFRLARELLALEAKKALPGYFWGTPALSLRLKDLNWVEGLHISAAVADDDDTSSAAAAADVDEAFSMFRKQVVGEYMEHMARIARKLFGAMAGELGLGAEQTASYLAEREGVFRAYRYPVCSSGQYMGMEAHTDSSVMSILNHDLVGGLEVVVAGHGDGDDGGRWYSVRPVAGTLVVNLGDMMQAISGDAYRSVRHRVVASKDTERMSLCYFAFPKEDAVIRHCGGGDKEHYMPFTYREFREQVQADIKAAGTKVGLARFRCAD